MPQSVFGLKLTGVNFTNIFTSWFLCKTVLCKAFKLLQFSFVIFWLLRILNVELYCWSLNKSLFRAVHVMNIYWKSFIIHFPINYKPAKVQPQPTRDWLKVLLLFFVKIEFWLVFWRWRKTWSYCKILLVSPTRVQSANHNLSSFYESVLLKNFYF